MAGTPATINSVVPGGWSIAAEFAFYALFPWIIYRCKSWEATFGWLAVAQVCSLVWNGWVVPILTRSIFAEFNRDQMWSFGYFGFPSQLPVFLVGILAYHAFSLTRSRHLERSAGWTFIIIAFVLMVSFKDFTLVRLIPRHVAFSFEFALLLLGLSIHPTRLLVNAVTCQLGRISFSAYLVHFAVLHGMSTLLSGLGDQPSFFRSDAVRFVLLVVTSLLLTAAVASVTYRLIEQPGISLGRWIIRRLEKQSPAGSLYGS